MRSGKNDAEKEEEMSVTAERKGGRPEKPIDWKIVDDLLIAGCTGTEVASHFDIHPHNFYDRIVKKHNMSFTDYAAEKRQKGHSLLRTKQFQKAMSGDTSMLIWLGKNKLDQRDSSKEETDTQLIVKTVQYIESQRDNITPQLPSTEVPAPDTPSA